MRIFSRIGTLSATAAALCLSLVVSSCGDPIPQDYDPLYVVEALLLVDQPIDGISVVRSQPVTQQFSLERSLVSTATVTISDGTASYTLAWRRDPIRGGVYYLPDRSVTVKPSTQYSLRIEAADGTVLTGTTKTPGSMSWTRPVRPVLQYPTNDLEFGQNDSLKIEWTPVEGSEAYFIGVSSLDTSNYGMYLPTPTDEANERIYRFFEANYPFYNETIRWSPALNNTDPPISWIIFKWYGRQKIAVYAPENNYYRWFQFAQRGQSPTYNELFNSIEGNGIGFFGASAVIYDSTFVLKRPR